MELYCFPIQLGIGHHLKTVHNKMTTKFILMFIVTILPSSLHLSHGLHLKNRNIKHWFPFLKLADQKGAHIHGGANKCM